MVVNAWQMLDDQGGLPTSSTASRAIALRVAQCIEYGGPLARGYWRETLIACPRRPGGAACPGLLVVLKQSDDAILAFCASCNTDDALIYEWEGTAWASGAMEPVPVASMSPETAAPPPGPDAHDELLARTLALLGSPRTPAEVRRLVATARVPTEVVQAVFSSLRAPPHRASLERFLNVLMDVWNDTRAAEAGRGPGPAAHRARPGPDQPCACGSGKKFKRCCMHGERIH